MKIFSYTEAKEETFPFSHIVYTEISPQTSCYILLTYTYLACLWVVTQQPVSRELPDWWDSFPLKFP